MREFVIMGVIGIAGILALAGWWRFYCLSRRLGSLAELVQKSDQGEDVSPLSGQDRLALLSQNFVNLLRSNHDIQAAHQINTQRISDAAEVASEWIWETDDQLHFTYFSWDSIRIDHIDANHFLGLWREDSSELYRVSEEEWAAYRTAVAHRQPFHKVLVRLHGQNGQFHYVLSSGKPRFDELGHFIGYRGVACDLTEEIEKQHRIDENHRLMTEALYEARENAERANHGKTRFLAAASHDLRQPLQAMGLFIATLAGISLPGKAQEIVHRIEESLEALEHLLDTLLDISKLDAGVVEVHQGSFPLQPLFERLNREFQPLARNKNLTLRFVPTHITIVSDATLLERILRNLLSNALRYTEKGGIVVGVRRQGDHRRIEVVDSGCGIPVDQQKEIFKEFHQLKRLPHRCRDGLGLGLAIVDRLSTLLGHTVSVRSISEHGSVFSVLIPVSDPSGSSAKPEHIDRLDLLKDKLVAVLDDDEMIRDGLESLLNSWGCRLILAATAKVLYDAVISAGEIPHLILADYRLDDNATGRDAVHAMRHLTESAIPAILITGDTSQQRIDQAIDEGMALLRKPVSPTTLRKEMERLLAGHSPISPKPLQI